MDTSAIGTFHLARERSNHNLMSMGSSEMIVVCIGKQQGLIPVLCGCRGELASFREPQTAGTEEYLLLDNKTA